MAIHPGLLVFLIALCSAVPCPFLQDSLARIISSTPKQATPPSSASGTRPSTLPVMAATPPPSAAGTRPSSAALPMAAVTPPPSSLQIRTLSASASLPPASPVDVEMSDALAEMTVVLDEMSDVLRPRDSTTPKAGVVGGLSCKDSFSPAVVEGSAKKVAAAGVAAVGLAAPKGAVAVLAQGGQHVVAAGAEVPVVSTAAKRSRIPRFV